MFGSLWCLLWFFQHQHGIVLPETAGDEAWGNQRWKHGWKVFSKEFWPIACCRLLPPEAEGWDVHSEEWLHGSGWNRMKRSLWFDGNPIEPFSGWWFGTFLIFPYIGNIHPKWLIFFRGVQTTNQFFLFVSVSSWHCMIVWHRTWRLNPNSSSGDTRQNINTTWCVWFEKWFIPKGPNTPNISKFD